METIDAGLAESMLPFARLQQIAGRERQTAVESWLRRSGVRYMLDAAGKPMTTVNAFDEAMASRVKRRKPKDDRGFKLDF